MFPGHVPPHPATSGKALRKEPSGTLDRLGTVSRSCSSGRNATRRPGPSRPRPLHPSLVMLLSRVTSTPFSVNDILRLEREQSNPEATSQWRVRRSPENAQYLQMDWEPREPEIHNAGSGGGGDRGQDPSELPGGLCEAVLEMDPERVGEPRE